MSTELVLPGLILSGCTSKKFVKSWELLKTFRLVTVQDFFSICCRFKDCVKTGDGIRAKKSSLGLARLTGSGREELTNKLTNLERGEMTKTGRGEEWQTGNIGIVPRF